MKIPFTLFLTFLLSLSLQAQEDNSLDILMEAGMPNLEDNWSMEDYNLAYLVLVNSIKEGSIDLPHHDKASFKALEKLIDAEGLFHYNDTSLNARFKKVSQIQLKISELQELYSKKLRMVNGTLNYGKEMLLIQSFAINMTSELSELGARMMIGKTDLTDRQKAGYARYQRGLKTILFGGLVITLDDNHYFKDEDVCTFASTLYSHFSSLEKRLEPKDRQELRKKIIESKGKLRLDCIQQALEKI